MTMNRVVIKCHYGAGTWLEGEKVKECFVKIKEYLEASCRNYYFISDQNSNNESRRYYFLSKTDMEDFIVWSKLALPPQEAVKELEYDVPF